MAEDAASRAIDLASGKGHEYLLCQLHQILGRVYGSNGEKEKAIHHFETAIRIASPFNWHDILFWTHYSLALLFLDKDEFDDASTHITRAKKHAVNDAYQLGSAVESQAKVWYRQRSLEDAKTEALHALQIYESLWLEKDVARCRNLLQKVKRAKESGKLV